MKQTFYFTEKAFFISKNIQIFVLSSSHLFYLFLAEFIGETIANKS